MRGIVAKYGKPHPLSFNHTLRGLSDVRNTTANLVQEKGVAWQKTAPDQVTQPTDMHIVD